MSCDICNGKLNIFNEYITTDGFICKKCYKKIPYFIRHKHPDMLVTQINLLTDYFKESNKKNYDATASLGILEIDEINGVFALKENNTLYKFDCLDIKEGELICTNIKADKYNNVFCDIEFRCIMDNPNIDFKIRIKKNIKCKKHHISIKSIEWGEPSELSMFRNLFNSMIKKQIDKYSKKVKDTIIRKADIEYLKAKSLYMIDDEYTLEEINTTKKQLLRVFHPDEQDGDNNKSKIILKYYEILKNAKNEDIE